MFVYVFTGFHKFFRHPVFFREKSQYSLVSSKKAQFCTSFCSRSSIGEAAKVSFVLNLFHYYCSVSNMVLLALIQIVVYVWSILTWPIYFLIYWPIGKTSRYNKNRSMRVDIQKDETTYRAFPLRCRTRDALMNHNDNINTMDKVLKYGAQKFGNKRCLGTRRILHEKQIEGPTGKMLNKLVMEPTYKWLTYQEVDQKSTYVGRGLQILGLKPRDKLVMYCDTKAEWMVTAMGCFKYNYTLGNTIYRLSQQVLVKNLEIAQN